MIVVEGFDGSGKSTLAKALGQEFSCPVYHAGGPTKNLPDVVSCLHRSRTRMLTRCVQDRVTHISESVYSMHTRPAQAAMALDHLWQISFARAVIYCRPPDALLLDEIRRHVPKEHETAEHVRTVIENAEKLISIYDVVMHMVERRTFVYRYDRSEQHQSVMDVFDYVRGKV